MITSTEWNAFLEWLYSTHQIAKTWVPDKTSIEIWEEYRQSKKGKSK